MYSPLIIMHTDIETTSLDIFNGAIHQISGIMEVDGSITSRFNFLMRPHINAKIDPQSLKVSGVKYNTIRSYTAPDIAFQQFIDIPRIHIRPGNKIFISAFNGSAMEHPFIREMYKRNGYGDMFKEHFHSACLDTMSGSAAYLLSKDMIPVNYTLAGIAQALGVQVDNDNLHNAVYDAELSYHISRKIFPRTSINTTSIS